MKALVVMAVAVVLSMSGSAMAVVEAAPPVDTAEGSAGPIAAEEHIWPLDTVLERLVEDGTLSRAQAETVAAAVRERFKVKHRWCRIRCRSVHAGIRIGLLIADGVIDAAELAGLPEGHPLRRLDGPAGPYLDDGELTIDELRALQRSRVTGSPG